MQKKNTPQANTTRHTVHLNPQTIMSKDGIRNTYTTCPFAIHMCDNAGTISTGTAFFYEVDNKWFLITNWHNVSGKDFLTKFLLSKEGRIPTFLEAKFFVHNTSIKKDSVVALPHEISLYEDNEPIWFEHPEHGSNYDVVALPMSRPDSCPEEIHQAANRISEVRIPITPGGSVFIVGFPRSISVGPGLPLWKSGYIASEPLFDVTIGGKTSEIGGLKGGTKLPAFFLDSQTREGMSGSPVFAQYTGWWDKNDPYNKIDRNNLKDLLSGVAYEFVGCYSGRVKENEEKAALGLCWPEDVIKQICSAKNRGVHP